MKYLKYIVMALLVVSLAACSDKEPTYPMDPVDESTNCYVSIDYIVPLTNVVANRIYKIRINDHLQENRGAALMNPYGEYPGGSKFFVTKAGEVQISLYDNKDAEKYNGTVTLEAGKHYNIYIYDLDKAPVAIERTEYPEFIGSDTSVYAANIQFINFLQTTAGTPTTDKLQVYLVKNAWDAAGNAILDEAGKQRRDTVAMGEPVGFGEFTTWHQEPIHWNGTVTTGTERKDLFIEVIGADGTDKGMLQYTRSNGRVGTFTDYWTLGAGRSYHWVIRGLQDNKNTPVAISSFAVDTE